VDGSHFKTSDHVRGQGAGRRKSGAYMVVCESRQRRDHHALDGVLKRLLVRKVGRVLLIRAEEGSHCL
jgi:hypothetical protein